MNELHPRGIPDDWIEFINQGTDPIPLCAVFITQEYDGTTPPSGGDRYTFGHVTLGGGQRVVITATVDFPFGLDKDVGERVTLFAPDASVLDDTTYPAPPEWESAASWAREPDSSGDFEKTCSPTKAAENVYTGCGGGGGAGGGP
jgi:hypothetical protein